MQIVIAIIVIGLIIVLAKYILFHPRVNSVLTIIVFIVYIITAFQGNGKAGPGILIMSILPIIDCIHDIAIAPKYYEDIEFGVDKLYKIKSLVSLFTGGFARPIFLVIVGPCLSFSVRSEIQGRIDNRMPLPYEGFSDLMAKEYYYQKHIARLKASGIIVSNVNAVDEETKKRREMLDKLYPQKVIAKVVDMVAGDKDAKSIRQECEKKLEAKRIKQYYAYMSANAFSLLPDLLNKAMSQKGYCSAADISKFDELKELHTAMPSSASAPGNATAEWSEYFVIQALEPLVKKGIFVRDRFNDNDPFDNPAYSYTKSEVKMPSIDANSDPLLALDDDD